MIIVPPFQVDNLRASPSALVLASRVPNSRIVAVVVDCDMTAPSARFMCGSRCMYVGYETLLSLISLNAPGGAMLFDLSFIERPGRRLLKNNSQYIAAGKEPTPRRAPFEKYFFGRPGGAVAPILMVLAGYRTYQAKTRKGIISINSFQSAELAVAVGCVDQRWSASLCFIKFAADFVCGPLGAAFSAFSCGAVFSINSAS